MNVESSDFIKSSAAQASPEPAKEEPKKKLPTAPAMKKPVAPTKADEQPSTTGTPKLETLVHGSALGDQKEGESPRRRLASGDLSDDFMSADLGFDVSPALAPPAADALLKAPVSSRPAPSKEGTTGKSTTSKPAASKQAAKSSSKTARPVVIKPESSAGSSRGKMAVLALVVLGGGALLFRDRLAPRAAEPDPPSAEAPVAAQTPEPPAAEPAPAAAEPPPEPATSAPAEAQPSTPSPPATGVSGPATPSTATTPSTPAPASPEPASTAVAAAPKPAESAAPAPTEPREPRGSAGTEPFDAAAARAALDASAAQASTCRKPGDPSGVAVVMITFAPTGRVTSANISGPPFAATPTGGCIASTLRKTRVPAFAGDMVTVKKTVTIH
jgi:cytoskeletal protein RodZ